MIDPGNTQFNREVPPVAIEQIRIDDQPLAAKRQRAIFTRDNAAGVLLHRIEFRSA